jgi:O-methyltransferase
MIGPIERFLRSRAGRRKQRGLDADALETIRRVERFTMLGPEKLFALIQAVRYVARHAVPGDLVECGVWRGGAVMAAALTLAQLGVRDRRIFLYDTFSGMPPPTDADWRPDLDPRELFARRRTGPGSSDWCRAGVDEVRRNLASLPYPDRLFELVEGRVEDTIPGTLPDSIAILRLDTDWYESTRHEMEHLMPRLVPGGVLILDDYYNWTGSRRAVDEYLEREKIPILLTRVSSGAVGVKR